MSELLALADDLTGAMEAAALLAASGVRAILLPAPAHVCYRAGVPATVANLETRHEGEAEAARKVFEWASFARQQGVHYLFKKTDSTLRGHIGAELHAVMSAWPGRPLVYVPAYPRMGRAARGGRLYVDGRPLEETAFAGDPLEPVRSCSLVDVLGGAVSAASVEDIRAEDAALNVLDGESENDLAVIAAGLEARGLLTLTAGPAGFIAHLAGRLPLPQVDPPPTPKASRGLILSGSLHPVSRRQIREAAPLEAWRVLETPGCTGKPSHAEARNAAGALAWQALAVIEDSKPEALIVFGGDTAMAVLRALDIREAEPLGELLPGVPAARICHHDRELVLVTKAGGFGPPDVVDQIRRRLEPAT